MQHDMIQFITLSLLLKNGMFRSLW